MYPLWQASFRSRTFPKCDVVHSVMGFATEPFRLADRMGALKVLDASNSHPTSFYGFWQRELDIWNPGKKVGVPRRVLFASYYCHFAPSSGAAPKASSTASETSPRLTRWC